jgi:hypothetical protein
VANKLKVYTIPADKDGLDKDFDVDVSFDGYRLGLSFEDGNKYLIILDELLAVLNSAAEEVGCEEAGIKELEQFLKTVQKARHDTVEERPVTPKPLPDVKPQGIDPAGHRKLKR